MQIHCSIHSVILNVMATVHMPTQWHLLPPLASRVKSSMFMHTHSCPLSPWLSGYVDAAQTILVILTMAGIFLKRPHITQNEEVQYVSN